MSSNGNGKAKGDGHSPEQGMRLHHLANLGGLIALAGLDLEPPDFLLGALLSVAAETAQLNDEQRAHIAKLGRDKLDTRATGKRAWKSWQRARELHPVTLSSRQLREIIEALGGKAPESPTKLVLALSEALTEVCDEAD